MAGDVAKLSIVLGADTRGMDAGFARARKNISGFQSYAAKAKDVNLTADPKGLASGLQSGEKQLTGFGATAEKVKDVSLSADTRGFTGSVAGAEKAMGSFAGTADRASEVTLTADTAGFTRAVSEAEGELGNFGSAAAGAGAASGFFRTKLATVAGTTIGLRGAVGGLAGAAGLGALTLGFGAAARQGLMLNDNMEQARIAFTSMLGGAREADSFLRSLADFAAKTPFEFPELITASQRMLAFGFSAKEVRPLLTAVGNAAAAMGRGSEGVDQITYALGQMRASTVVQLGEINQLTEAGVPAYEILAKATGKSAAEAKELASQGKIASDVFINAFQEWAQSNFGNMMARQSRTAAGAFSTLKDNINAALREAFGPLYERVRENTVALAEFTASARFQSWADAAARASERVFNAFDKLGGGLSDVLDLDAPEPKGFDKAGTQAATRFTIFYNNEIRAAANQQGEGSAGYELGFKTASAVRNALNNALTGKTIDFAAFVRDMKTEGPAKTVAGRFVDDFVGGVKEAFRGFNFWGLLKKRLTDNKGASDAWVGALKRLKKAINDNKGVSAGFSANLRVLKSRLTDNKGASQQWMGALKNLRARIADNKGASATWSNGLKGLKARLTDNKGASQAWVPILKNLKARFTDNQGASKAWSGGLSLLKTRLTDSRGASGAYIPVLNNLKAALDRNRNGTVSLGEAFAAMTGKVKTASFEMKNTVIETWNSLLTFVANVLSELGFKGAALDVRSGTAPAGGTNPHETRHAGRGTLNLAKGGALSGPRQPKHIVWGEGPADEAAIFVTKDRRHRRDNERYASVAAQMLGGKFITAEELKRLQSRDVPPNRRGDHRHTPHERRERRSQQLRRHGRLAPGMRMEGFGPAMYTWIPEMQNLVNKVKARFPVSANTYTNHPPGFAQPFYRERSADFWSPAGRGSPIGSIWPDVASYAGSIAGSATNWILNPSNDPAGHWDHVHITAWAGGGGAGRGGFLRDKFERLWGPVDRFAKGAAEKLQSSPYVLSKAAGGLTLKAVDSMRETIASRIGMASGGIVGSPGNPLRMQSGGLTIGSVVGQTWPSAERRQAAATAWLESKGNARAVNPSSGASGLFQFLQSTFTGIGGDWSRVFDPIYNSQMAAKLQDRYGWGQWAVTPYWGSGVGHENAPITGWSGATTPTRTAPSGSSRAPTTGGLRAPTTSAPSRNISRQSVRSTGGGTVRIGPMTSTGGGGASGADLRRVRETNEQAVQVLARVERILGRLAPDIGQEVRGGVRHSLEDDLRMRDSLGKGNRANADRRAAAGPVLRSR